MMDQSTEPNPSISTEELALERWEDDGGLTVPMHRRTLLVTLPALIFDGACGFCTWTVDFLQARLREPVLLAPWQRIDLREIGLSRQQVEEAAWWLDAGGKKLRGHLAVARALQACRLPWRALGILLSWPGISWASAYVYQFVSRNRRHLPGTTPALRRSDNRTQIVRE